MCGVRSIRNGSPGRTHRGAVLAVITLVVGLSAACGSRTVESVRPLGDASAPRVTAPGTGHVPTGEPSTSAPPLPAATTPVTTEPATAGGPGETARDVLDRYDRVLARLHARPAAVAHPGDPAGAELLSELDRVVPPGAVLADDVRSQLAGRAARGEAIPFDGSTLPYVHRPVDATAEGPDRVSFTWCSWSPGVVRDLSSGAVIDDAVGHGTGTGVAERIGGTWMLSSLDEATLELLPPGRPDPCPVASGARP